MTLVETEMIGRVRREKQRSRDREAAILYIRPLRNRFRKESEPGRWVPSPMETWAHKNNRFIAESLCDDEADLELPPHERPGLLRLAALTVLPSQNLPGGVLVEHLDALVKDPIARAVLGRLLQRRVGENPPLWYNNKSRPRVTQVKAAELERWITDAGTEIVDREVEIFKKAAVQHLLEITTDPIHLITHLGTGPLRDENLARMQYQRLAGSHSEADIRRYLETYGYTNPAGTVGRWYHQNLKALRDN